MSSGQAIQILIENKTSFTLNIEGLQEILTNEKIKDKKVILISIAGEMRRGKSFMLNFFLRYLQSEDKENWLGGPDTPLKGFSWKNGKDFDTTGILMWSEPFIVRAVTGEECALLLMDTQGSFDKRSTMKKNAMIFALSTMVSSVQIFNIHSQLREDHLEFLSIFVNYGRLAMETDESDKPFQHLQFLIRDWSSPYMNPFGMNGGKEYLEEFLKYDTTDNSQIIEVRKFIRQCFSRIDCCLMPFPGTKVIATEMFDGKVGQIKKIFIDSLLQYVPKLLSEKYLLPKSISGFPITCMQLLYYFKIYFRVFNSDDLVAPLSIFNASAEATNMVSLDICKRFYHDEMVKIVNEKSKFLREDKLLIEHQQISLKTMEKFRTRKKFGYSEMIEEYRLKLEEEMEESFKAFINKNALKSNTDTNTSTLFVLVVWYIIGQVVRHILLSAGLNAASSTVGWILFSIVLMSILWAFLNYLDSPVKDYIDRTINMSWDIFLRPFYNLLIHKVVRTMGQNTLQTLHVE